MTLNPTYILIAVLLTILAFKFYLNRGVTEGAKAPEISGSLVNGTAFSSEDLLGNYVLIDFWGSWCMPCRKEIPMLEKLYQEFHDRNYKGADNFEILSVAIEKRKEGALRLINSGVMDWPYHIVEENAIVLSNPSALRYKVSDLPAKILVNPKGEIIDSKMSVNQIEDFLKKVLKD